MTASLDHQAVIGLICAQDWSCGLAVRVASCESGLRPEAANRHSSARGVFQVLGGSLDAATNIVQAHAMWAARGWQPWSASRACWSR